MLRWIGFFLLDGLSLVLELPILVLILALGLPVPWWANTPDDPNPETQGLYEAQVADVRIKYGQFIKTLYWLWWRNRCYGLFWRLAPKAPAGTLRFSSAAVYPSVSPFRPGFCRTSITIAGKTYHEWTWVWPYSATKCGMIRVGWKVKEADVPGPITYCFQPKIFPLTKG